MWDLHAVHPFGRLSIRNTFLFAIASAMVLFLSLFAMAPTANAQAATWEGDSISYDGNTYQQMFDGENEELYGIPDGSQVYGRIDTESNPPKAHIIYFAANADPATAEEATYVVYDFTPPATLTNPTDQKTVSFGDDAQTAAESEEGATSCDGRYTHGIGWIICPVTNFLASGMDWLFNILSTFLVVTPVSTDQNSVLYRAWGFMRNLANVLFVVGFLIIIYSQITSFGLSNYGVKRMMPRLIIAAVLVNVSYWIAAIAIDLSNILGYAFQEMFVSMRNSLDTPNDGGWQLISWESMAGFILSGGAILAGIGVLGAGLVTAGVGASVMLLLPILVGVILSALVAILVLAARQALITILVILAPLACVAYLLPNTEKYFERWRDLFMTMLLVFPIFSIVFGGSQLAGTAIILTAAKSGGPNAINMVLLGMAVQIAPVVVTPLLIKLSGNLLGRLAGIVNNPNKGLIDRSRNFANERAGLASARRLGDRNADGSFRHNWPATRLARRLQYGKMNRAGRQKAYEGSAEAGFENTDDSHQIHALSMTAADHKKRGSNEATYMYNTHKNNNPGLQALEMDARAFELRANNASKETDATWNALRAGPTSRYIVPAHLATVALEHNLQQAANTEKALDSNIVSAQYVQTRNFADAVQDDPEMLELAGGIDPNGLTRAKANAVSTITRSRAELVKNIEESSDVLPGNMPGLQEEFRAAVRANNAEAMRAYAETMTAAGNPGVTALRNIIEATEGEMSEDSRNYLKYFIDSNSTLNSSAEDIVTWSRRNQTLTSITTDAGTWTGLSPIQFVSQKQSSQMAALDTGGISSTTAMRVLQSDAVKDLKPAVFDRLKTTAGYPVDWSPGDPVPPGWTP